MNDQTTLLKEISEVSFALNDLTLFLDTHPDCSDALQYFYQLAPKREQLMKQYAESYEPLTLDCAGKLPAKRSFSWLDGPAPWEGGAC